MHSELLSYPVSIQQNITWSDMDAYQHVNNAVYFRYFEDVRMSYFEKIGVNAYMSEHNIGPILASTTANYKAPLTYPDKLTIAARISTIHNKKLTMDYIVYSHSLDKIAAIGSGLVVYFDYNQHHSCQIPEPIIKQIKLIEHKA